MRDGNGRWVRGGIVAILLALLVATAHAAPRRGFYADWVDTIEDPDFAELHDGLRAEGYLEMLAEELNAAIDIPVAVSVAFEECGQANAFYDPNARRIILCYELVAEISALLAEEGEDHVEQYLDGAILFFFMHELGHALTDVLDLPITGKEEDAVDQLAAIVFSGGDEHSDAALYGAATTFAKFAEYSAIDDGAFADSHSLNEQRVFNILCWAYGSDPERNAAIVDEGLLPEDRAAECPAEFAQIERSWERLLGDHLK